MSGKQVLWESPRPILTVERDGGGKLGNCYYNTVFRITTTRALDVEEIQALRIAGFLGGGQEFYIRGQLMEGGWLVPVPQRWPHKDDWRKWEARQNHPPSGTDTVHPTVRDSRTGERLDEQPIHEITGQPITNTHDFPYFVYLVEERVDSSD
jgi:hypothetical protein